jgi:hypothetical protein
MADIKLGQNISGSISNRDNKLSDNKSFFNGYFFQEYDLKDIGNTKQTSISLQLPSNSAGTTYLQLIDTATGNVISENGLSGNGIITIAQSTQPNTNYKLRVLNNTPSNYQLSLQDSSSGVSVLPSLNSNNNSILPSNNNLPPQNNNGNNNGVDNKAIGAKIQSGSEGRLIDITDYNGKNFTVDVKTTSEASYNNNVGFYRVIDASGAIRLGDGTVLKPGDANYAREAVKDALTNPGLQAGKTDSKSIRDFAGGSIFAPVVIAQGSLNEFIDRNPKNEGEGDRIHAYFNYVGANPDRKDHFKLTGTNTFAVEDLYGGGDNDFNDVVISLNFKQQ